MLSEKQLEDHMIIDLTPEHLNVIIRALNSACTGIEAARVILPVVDSIDRQISSSHAPKPEAITPNESQF